MSSTTKRAVTGCPFTLTVAKSIHPLSRLHAPTTNSQVQIAPPRTMHIHNASLRARDLKNRCEISPRSGCIYCSIAIPFKLGFMETFGNLERCPFGTKTTELRHTLAVRARAQDRDMMWIFALSTLSLGGISFRIISEIVADVHSSSSVTYSYNLDTPTMLNAHLADPGYYDGCTLHGGPLHKLRYRALDNLGGRHASLGSHRQPFRHCCTLLEGHVLPRSHWRHPMAVFLVWLWDPGM